MSAPAGSSVAPVIGDVVDKIASFGFMRNERPRRVVHGEVFTVFVAGVIDNVEVTDGVSRNAAAPAFIHHIIHDQHRRRMCGSQGPAT